ncbi:phage tail family protein [Lactiplantibacillus plantarum]|uniref:phage tail domain-containing protein n=1 Tax=Lactiplantibacillus plantarum TaxID=1590 RepID=UPI000D2001CD|nr:phage tail domain-containing protein [Lactiplantibacillus plantarum]AVW05399.1 phage tail protein [Lactiplantibacillus plantarum]MCT3222365.1 phage tail family protein [Lactiplantibacillus plantarum]
MQIFSTRTDRPHAYRFGETDNKLPFNPIEYAISVDGTNWASCFDVPNLQGVYMYDATLPDINPADTYQALGQQDGQTLMSSRYDQRDITCQFYSFGIDEADQSLGYQALERFLYARDEFWITFSNHPGIKFRVKAKTFKPTYPNEKDFYATVTFNNSAGLGQSLGTTQDVEDFDSELWALGQNLRLDQDLQYSFQNMDRFTVVNIGDIMIEPDIKQHPLIITIHCNGKPTLTNTTTGQTFSCNRILTTNDELKLSGVNPFINGQQCGSDTNHGVISLQLGDNQFTLTGCTDSNISFDTPFYYV